MFKINYEKYFHQWINEFHSKLESNKLETDKSIYILNIDFFQYPQRRGLLNNDILLHNDIIDKNKVFVILNEEIWLIIKRDFPKEKEIRKKGSFNNHKFVFQIETHIFYFYFLNEQNEIEEGYFEFQHYIEGNKIIAIFFDFPIKIFFQKMGIRNNNLEQKINYNGIFFKFRIKPKNARNEDIIRFKDDIIDIIGHDSHYNEELSKTKYNNSLKFYKCMFYYFLFERDLKEKLNSKNNELEDLFLIEKYWINNFKKECNYEIIKQFLRRVRIEKDSDFIFVSKFAREYPIIKNIIYNKPKEPKKEIMKYNLFYYNDYYFIDEKTLNILLEIFNINNYKKLFPKHKIIFLKDHIYIIIYDSKTFEINNKTKNERLLFYLEETRDLYELIDQFKYLDYERVLMNLNIKDKNFVEIRINKYGRIKIGNIFNLSKLKHNKKRKPEDNFIPNSDFENINLDKNKNRHNRPKSTHFPNNNKVKQRDFNENNKFDFEIKERKNRNNYIDIKGNSNKENDDKTNVNILNRKRVTPNENNIQTKLNYEYRKENPIKAFNRDQGRFDEDEKNEKKEKNNIKKKYYNNFISNTKDINNNRNLSKNNWKRNNSEGREILPNKYNNNKDIKALYQRDIDDNNLNNHDPKQNNFIVKNDIHKSQLFSLENSKKNDMEKNILNNKNKKDKFKSLDYKEIHGNNKYKTYYGKYYDMKNNKDNIINNDEVNKNINNNQNPNYNKKNVDNKFYNNMINDINNIKKEIKTKVKDKGKELNNGPNNKINNQIVVQNNNFVNQNNPNQNFINNPNNKNFANNLNNNNIRNNFNPKTDIKINNNFMNFNNNNLINNFMNINNNGINNNANNNNFGNFNNNFNFNNFQNFQNNFNLNNFNNGFQNNFFQMNQFVNPQMQRNNSLNLFSNKNNIKNKLSPEGKEIKRKQFYSPPNQSPPSPPINITKNHANGLENIGATCYMNATLQCLANISQLTKHLLKPKNMKEISSNKYKYKLTNSFVRVLNNLWLNNSIRYYSPVDFKNVISGMNPLFAGIQANDSKDLILFLLETMHNELNMARKNTIQTQNINQYNYNQTFQIFSKYFAENYLSVISNLFYGMYNSMMTCLNCNITTHNVQCYNILIFPLEEVRIFKKRQYNVVDILECFEYYEKMDFMTGANQIHCNNCHTMANSCNVSKIIISPNVLVINLNRGKGLQFNVKLNFQEYLDIRNFVYYKNSPNYYELIGIVTHFGPSSMGGHFIAFCKSFVDFKWYKYNDAQVNISSFSEASTTGVPYILFYSMIKR